MVIEILQRLRCLFCLSGLLLLGGHFTIADPLKVAFTDFTPVATNHQGSSWQKWAQREEIQPHCYIDSENYRSAPNSLAISGNSNAASYGGWSTIIDGVKPGRYYAVTAYYQTRWVRHEQLQVVARIDWLNAKKERTGQPDYAYQVSSEGNWKKVTLRAPAPGEASGVKLELTLGWAPQGTVWWDDITLEEVAAPKPRIVRIGSVSLRPKQTGSKTGSLNAFLKALDEVAAGKPDIVCLGEGISMIGNSQSYVELAETIPGPDTARLGELARQHGMYIVAGLYEREGQAIYNTAVLINRQGEVAGKYRKVYLPREEIEGGLTPGLGYPVFQTDFGKIGIMICWDSEYTDPGRALAAQGAEIIFLPIWGGDLVLMRARAIENHVYLVSAGYDVETSIINPKGEILHSTKDSGVMKVVPIDLEERLPEPWLGDMRARFHKEIRWDVPIRGLME